MRRRVRRHAPPRCAHAHAHTCVRCDACCGLMCIPRRSRCPKVHMLQCVVYVHTPQPQHRCGLNAVTTAGAVCSSAGTEVAAAMAATATADLAAAAAASERPTYCYCVWPAAALLREQGYRCREYCGRVVFYPLVKHTLKNKISYSG